MEGWKTRPPGPQSKSCHKSSLGEGNITVATTHRIPQLATLPPPLQNAPLRKWLSLLPPTPPEQILWYPFFFEPLAPESKVGSQVQRRMGKLGSNVFSFYSGRQEAEV